VLRADYSARTVRIAIISSAAGTADIPALTQVAGVTWEIPLASFVIADGSGAISALTDQREFTQAPSPAGRFVARGGLTRYTMPGWGIGDLSTPGMGALPDRVIFQLIQVHKQMTFTALAIYLATNANGGEVLRMGLYEVDDEPDGLTPGALILDAGSVAIDAGAAAIKEIAISQVLAQGYYFLAHVHDATGGTASSPDKALSISAPVTAPTIPALTSGNFLASPMTAADGGYIAALPDPAPAITGLASAAELRVFMKDAT
jgi:hypothetical protein